MYIATSDQIDMDPYIDNAPRNWIPSRKRKTLQQHQELHETFDSSRNLTQCSSIKGQLQHSEDRLYDESEELNLQRSTHANMMKVKAKELLGKEATDRLSDESTSREAPVNNNDGEMKTQTCRAHIFPATPRRIEGIEAVRVLGRDTRSY